MVKITINSIQLRITIIKQRQWTDYSVNTLHQKIKEIYHPSIIQEWKLNIDAADYEKNMTLTCVPSTNVFNLIDNLGTEIKKIRQLKL